MKKTTKHVLYYAIISFLIGIILFLPSFLTYPYDISNCKEILKIEYQLPQEDLIDCIKIINQPIYSYYLPNFFINQLSVALILGTICFIRFLIKDTDGDFYGDDLNGNK